MSFQWQICCWKLFAAGNAREAVLGTIQPQMLIHEQYTHAKKGTKRLLDSFPGAPGGIRTHCLPLRSAKKRSPLAPFDTPGVPYFTGFLTFLSVRISLQNTPVFPG